MIPLLFLIMNLEFSFPAEGSLSSLWLKMDDSRTLQNISLPCISEVFFCEIARPLDHQTFPQKCR